MKTISETPSYPPCQGEGLTPRPDKGGAGGGFPREAWISVLILLFLLLISLPLLQTLHPFLHEPILNGVTQTAPKPVFRLENWLNGTLQTQIENWLDARMGLRGYFVKTDNQLNFWLFHEIHQKNTRLVVGKENYLYERNYLETYNGQDHKPLSALEERVKQLKTL
jgi:hypothetical protein